MKSVVVLVAHGTVSSLDELPEFVTEVRRGRPPPPELITELRHRYSQIGGSPLLTHTQDLAAKVAARAGCEVRVAMRFGRPKLHEVVPDLAAGDRIVLVPLAPYSVKVYEAAARAELALHNPAVELAVVPDWGDHPALQAAWVALIRSTVAERFGGVVPPDTALLLTAHSLPQAVIDHGDPYAIQFEASARALGAALDLPFAGLSVAYQSQGAMAGAWLGPSLSEVLGQLKSAGMKQVCLVPSGFLADHVETLYDLDVEARGQAESLGLGLVRVPALNASEGLAEAIAVLVGDEFERSAPGPR